MIKLHPDVIASFDYLKIPPTHADQVYFLKSFVPDGVQLDPGMRAMVGKPHLEVAYAYGTLDKDGKHIPCAQIPLKHVLIDLKDYSQDPGPYQIEVPMEGAETADGKALRLKQQAHFNDAHEIHMKKTAAARNLLEPGKAPKPGAPHESLSVPVKRAGQFKPDDVDHVAAYFYPELKGEAGV